MREPVATIHHLVPRGSLCTWLLACAALPLVILWLDPLTDATRLAVHCLPGAETLMQAARPFGKFQTQVLGALLAFILARRAGWRQARSWLALSVASLILVGAVTYPIKLLVRRERPAAVSARIPQQGTVSDVVTGRCMSFPSGDVASAFALATVLTALAPGLRLWGNLVACLVGVSRIYFGCHYFSDVVAGALLGTLSAAWLLAATRRRRVVVA